MREIMKLESIKMMNNIHTQLEENSKQEGDNVEISDVQWDQKNRFYMTMPDAGGYFYASIMYNIYDPTACFYEFEENKDGSYFFRLKDDSLRLAMKYPDKIIDPVCDILNGSMLHSTKLKVMKYGKPLLKNDTFIVIDRLKVKLE